MSKKYYRERDTNTHVWFKLLDINGNVIKDHSDEICFASILMYPIPKETAIIHIWHNRSTLPYDIEEIERWINDLNEMDFPCAYIGSNADHYNFQINVCDYEYKSHLMGTLMLLRMLTETGLCMVPEIYFQMMDADPKADKFDILQTAHKKPREHNRFYGIGNTGHMVTFDGNGRNVVKEKLFEQYKYSKYSVLHGSDKPGQYIPIQQSAKWNGDTNV